MESPQERAKCACPEWTAACECANHGKQASEYCECVCHREGDDSLYASHAHCFHFDSFDERWECCRCHKKLTQQEHARWSGPATLWRQSEDIAAMWREWSKTHTPSDGAESAAVKLAYHVKALNEARNAWESEYHRTVNRLITERSEAYQEAIRWQRAAEIPAGEAVLVTTPAKRCDDTRLDGHVFEGASDTCLCGQALYVYEERATLAQECERLTYNLNSGLCDDRTLQTVAAVLSHAAKLLRGYTNA